MLAAAIGVAAPSLAPQVVDGVSYAGSGALPIREIPTMCVAVSPPAEENVVYVEEPPPEPVREVIVERERPSVEYVWVGGYWEHDGRRYDWHRGHWDRPPHPHAVWVAPRYEHRSRGYVYFGGHWR